MGWSTPLNSLSDVLESLLAPVDSALMWNKLRGTPGGEELYQNSSASGAPFLRGLANWWKGYLTSGKDTLPTELEYPGSSLLGRYAVHIPYVPQGGVESPQGIQFQHPYGKNIDWLEKTLFGQNFGNPEAAGRNLAVSQRGSLDLIAGDVPTLEQSIRHERTHGATNSAMTPLMQERYLPALPQQFPKAEAGLRSVPGYANLSPDRVGNEMLSFANQMLESDRPPAAREALNTPVGQVVTKEFNENWNPRALRKPGNFNWSDVSPWESGNWSE